MAAASLIGLAACGAASASIGSARPMSATTAAHPHADRSATASPARSRSSGSADPAGADHSTPAAGSSVQVPAAGVGTVLASPSQLLPRTADASASTAAATPTAEPSTAAAGSSTAASPSPSGTSEPGASPIDGIPTLGPLFAGGLASAHGCSASVVDSPDHNLLVTAAHCVSGTGAGVQFVPGYLDGAAPNGVWTVQAAFVDPSWISSQDPMHDYAFLQVAAQVIGGRSQNVEDVVGADTLGLTPGEGDTVTVEGYGAGSDDRPISCTSTVSLTEAYPTFACAGFVDGTSGGPWLGDGAGAEPTLLVGLVGGLKQGGCQDDTSYSSPFDLDTVKLWQRASAGTSPDTLPAAGPSGC